MRNQGVALGVEMSPGRAFFSRTTPETGAETFYVTAKANETPKTVAKQLGLDVRRLCALVGICLG